MSLKWCLIFLITLRCCLTKTRYISYICLFLRLGLYVSYSCDLFWHYYFHFHHINQIVSLIHTNLSFGRVCQNFSFGCSLAFCLKFCQFQPDVAYRSAAYKKACRYLKLGLIEHLLNDQKQPFKDVLQIRCS